MLDVVASPYCTVVRLEPWDAPAGRYFASYSTAGRFCSLAGHSVVDEFCTLSSPILLAPRALLGKIYDAGIGLGHRRDPEMGLDLGWPPLCIGLEAEAPELPVGWQDELMQRLTEPLDSERPLPAHVVRRSSEGGPWQLAMVRQGEATVLATSAPLLPRQLRRLCEVARSDAVVGVATGNRLHRAPPEGPHRVRALSEIELDRLLAELRELVASKDVSEVDGP